MIIVADENIPAAQEAFSSFGEVRTYHGRQMTADDVRDADVLLVRSITRVDESLLSGSQVKFVGSATIGTDHVDIDWLRSQDISFANAPGSNATSAAEYVMSALFAVARKASLDLQCKTVGIIGCGNVGSRVQARMQAVGLRCLICDPPRAEQEGQSGFVSMEEIASADIVSVHVPLIKAGKHKTRNLVSQDFITALPADCLFINTSRGDVVDESALKNRLVHEKQFNAVLDVWNNEPVIDVELAQMAAIATPHIAGYSIDGKLRATQMLYNSLCAFLGKEPVWDAVGFLPEPAETIIDGVSLTNYFQVAAHCLHHVYDVIEDDKVLREALELPEDERGRAFDRLRKEYPARRECSAYGLGEKILSSEYAEMLTVFNLMGSGQEEKRWKQS